jgi:hypothetical protein
VLKSKQPLAFEVAAPVAKEPAKDDDLAAEDLVDEDAEVSPDEEVDLETGDNDLGVETAAEDDESYFCGRLAWFANNPRFENSRPTRRVVPV